MAENESGAPEKEVSTWEKLKLRSWLRVRALSKIIGYRVPLLIIGILVLFEFDFSTLKVVGFSLAFLSAQALASHVLRKVLFPYFDMSIFLEEAKKTPLSAAIALFSVCLVLSVLLYSAALLWVGRSL